jgi:hypothetical protein
MAHPKLVTAYAQYDFSVDGGAASTITPAITTEIPNNAIMVGCFTHVKTACTSSGSATVQINAGGVNLTPAVAFDDNEYDTANQVSNQATLNNSHLTAKATSDADIKIVVGTAALTAGVFDVYIQYYQSY